jgi:hypothetical protein
MRLPLRECGHRDGGPRAVNGRDSVRAGGHGRSFGTQERGPVPETDERETQAQADRELCGLINGLAKQTVLTSAGAEEESELDVSHRVPRRNECQQDHCAKDRKRPECA